VCLQDDAILHCAKGERLELPPMEIIKQGPLVKKGAKRTNWKERWYDAYRLKAGIGGDHTSSGNIGEQRGACRFVLRYRCLYYLNNRSDMFMKGYIPLINCTVAENNRKPHCFTIATDSRTFYIHANSEDEKRAWIEEIERYMHLPSIPPNVNRLISNSISISLSLTVSACYYSCCVFEPHARSPILLVEPKLQSKLLSEYSHPKVWVQTHIH